MSELEEDLQFSIVIESLHKNDLDGTIKLGMKHPVRIADFLIEEGNLKKCNKNDSCAWVVP